MKPSRSLILLVAAALGGCQSPPEPAPRPALPFVPSFAPTAGGRTPEVVRAYALGATIDPDDPSVRHDAHWIQRVESPARWDLRSPLPAGVGAGVEPTPVEAEVAAAPVVPPEPARPPVTTAPVVPPPEPTTEPALAPNADGLVDLTAAAAGPEAEGNPFAVRPPAGGPAREVTVVVSGVIGGARPCAVINDLVVAVGETIETLTVERIEERAVVVQCQGQRLRLPLSERPVRIRLPL